MLQRPALAAHIATIAHMWTHIDCLFGVLLTVLTGTEAHTSMTIYSSIVNSGARIDILRTLAKSKLDQESCKQLTSILQDYRKLSGARNNMIHGLWAISDEIPEQIFLINPIWHLNILASWAVGDITNTVNEEIMVYTEADFLSIQARISNFDNRLCSFSRDVEAYLQKKDGG